MNTNETYDKLIALLDANKAVYRLIDHPPEGQTDKVSAMRGHPVERLYREVRALRAEKAQLQQRIAQAATGGQLMREARRLGLTETLAVALQGSLLRRFSTPEIADAFIATRVLHQHGHTFGTGLNRHELKKVLIRAFPS